MNHITSVEFRNSLGEICERTKNGENFIVTNHGEPVLGIVSLRFLEIIDKCEKVDELIKKMTPEFQELWRILLIRMLNHVAYEVANLQYPVDPREIIEQIAHDLHNILIGKITENRLGK